MLFRFPPDARWNPDRDTVEFSIGVGEFEGVVRVSRRVFQTLLSERRVCPAKKDTPIRSPLTGLRGAFWMKARRWARIGSGRTCPTPRIVPIKAIWRGSIRKPQVHLLPPAKPDMPSRVMARRRAR
jgi:hypothetical protein